MGKKFAFMLLYFHSLQFDVQHDYFQKHFDPNPGIKGACKDKNIACMLLYVSFSIL